MGMAIAGFAVLLAAWIGVHVYAIWIVYNDQDE
jgi:hypothetical protein